MKINIDVRPFPPAVRADYWAGVVDGELLIVDSDLGNRSVTNDLEAVLLEVFRNLVPPEIAFDELKIRYRDSMGEWDRVVIERADSFLDDGILTAEIVWGGNEDPPGAELLQSAQQ